MCYNLISDAFHTFPSIWQKQNIGSTSVNVINSFLLLIIFTNLNTLPRQQAPVEFEKEYLMIIGDWFGEDSGEVFVRFSADLERFSQGYDNLDECNWNTMQTDGSNVAPVPFESALINGKGEDTSSSQSLSIRYIAKSLVSGLKEEISLYYEKIPAFQIRVYGHVIHNKYHNCLGASYMYKLFDFKLDGA